MINIKSLNDEYQPARGSVKSERIRLVFDVQELQKRLADAKSKSISGFDPSYMRLEYTLGKQLDAAKEKITAFDKKHRELDRAASSTDAKAAGVKATKAAEKFEEAILAAATAAAELKESAATLADELQVRDQNIWPSRLTVDTSIRGRIIEILGSKAGIKLDGFGSVGRRTDSLAKRFELNQGKWI